MDWSSEWTNKYLYNLLAILVRPKWTPRLQIHEIFYLSPEDGRLLRRSEISPMRKTIKVRTIENYVTYAQRLWIILLISTISRCSDLCSLVDFSWSHFALQAASNVMSNKWTCAFGDWRRGGFLDFTRQPSPWDENTASRFKNSKLPRWHIYFPLQMIALFKAGIRHSIVFRCFSYRFILDRMTLGHPPCHH